MDIEAMAAAIFAAFHAVEGRVRNWLTHPDHDGVEPGRDTFRAMAAAAAGVAVPPVAEVVQQPVAEAVVDVVAEVAPAPVAVAVGLLPGALAEIATP